VDEHRASPLLAELLSVHSPKDEELPDLSSIGRLRLLLETLVELLTWRINSRPLLLVMEDLQWADDSSLELVDRLIEFATAEPVFLILTTRRLDIARLTENDNITNIPLPPLSTPDGAILVNALTSGPKLPSAQINAILDWSDGIPLDIEEHTRQEILDWLQRFEGATGAARRIGDPGEISVPVARRDAIKSHLDRLSDGSQHVLRAAATVGPEFSRSQLCALLGVGAEDVDTLLDELQNAAIIEKQTPNQKAEYRFRHARYRDAAYESMSGEESKQFHSRMVSFLMSDQPELADTHPELLAYHLEGAVEPGPAIRYWIMAGTRSLRRAGFLEAVTQYEKAVDLLDKQDNRSIDISDELGLRIALGAAYEVRDGFSCSNARLQYERALDLCQNNPETADRDLFAIYSGYGSLQNVRGNFARVLEIADECLEAAKARRSFVGRVIGSRLRGGALIMQGHLDQGMSHLEEAVRQYDMHADAFIRDELYALDHKVTAMSYLALAMVARGQVRSALEMVRRSEEFAQQYTNLHSQNYAITYRAAVNHLLNDFDTTAEVAERSRTMAVEQGYASWEGGSRILLGHALFARGDVQRGREEFLLGRKIHETDTEARLYVPFIMSVAAKFLQQAGDREKALETVDGAIAFAESTGERWYLPELLRLKGELLFQMNSDADAVESLKKGYALATSLGADLWALRSALSMARLASDETLRGDAGRNMDRIRSGLSELDDCPDEKKIVSLPAR